MDRRCVSVCTTIVLFLLTLVHSGEASTSRKRAINKRPPISRSRATTPRSKGSKAAARATKSCGACAASLAKTKKGRASQRGAKHARSLPCHSKDYVDPKIAKNYRAAMRDMRRAGIKPRVTSVWRSSASQARLHRCSLSTRCRRSNPGLYRALPAGRSIHEAGFAVDIAGVATGPRGAKRLTPQGRRIVAIMKKNGFNWRYGLADPVHFEADPTKYGYRSVRHAIRKTQTTCQVRLAKSTATKKPTGKVAASRTRTPQRVRVSAHGGAARTRRAAAKATA
jgi:D-alanyl-D-alanine carboxypeptidase